MPPLRAGARAPALMLAAAGALLGVWLATKPAPRSAMGVSMSDARGGAPTIRRSDDADAVYRESLEPLLDAAAQRNQRIVDRALARLRERFDGFRAGAPALAEDMASWGSRLGVLRRMPSEWWDHATGERSGCALEAPGAPSAVATYIRGKFEKHVAPAGAVEACIEETIGQAADDLQASRNTLWGEIDLALKASDAPVRGTRFDARAMEMEASRMAASLASRHATGTLGAGLAALAVSTAGSIAVEQLTAQVVARIGVSVAAGAAAEAATGAGAAAAGAGTGATGGAVAGPVGVVVGVGLGLAVGFAIDWWMTDEFKSGLEKQVVAQLDALEREIVEGTGALPEPGGPRGPEAGLRAALLEAVEALDKSQRAAALAGVQEAMR